MKAERADLVFVTNIPTPYRSAFFNTLHELCDGRRLQLRVLYCARTEPRRSWPFIPAENRYSHEFLLGWAPTIANFTAPLNLGIRARLAALAPQVVVHAGSWNMPTNLIALAPPKQRWRALFWSEGHSDAVIHAGGPIAMARRAALRRYDGFVVPNARSRDWCEAQTGSAHEFHLLPNTVDEVFWRRTGKGARADARVRLSLGPDERIIVQVGHVEARKGALELARAFAAIAPSLRKGAKLVFVGGGSQAGAISEIARGVHSGAIRITGQLSREQVRDWLMAADVFALNTKRDPNPLTAIEASFAELPILMSSRAGNAQELMRGENGVLIEDPNRPGAALKAILGRSVEELRAMGERSRQIAEEGLTRSSVCNQFISGLLLDKKDCDD